MTSVSQLLYVIWTKYCDQIEQGVVSFYWIKRIQYNQHNRFLVSHLFLVNQIHTAQPVQYNQLAMNYSNGSIILVNKTHTAQKCKTTHT